jgi:cobyrinic acid a,c-diamide synthase
MISPLADRTLPQVDLLYAGGGFPEQYAEYLSANETMLAGIRAAAARGLCVYAEGGGLLYMSRGIHVANRFFPLVGALPVEITVDSRIRRHGYVEALTVFDTPYYRKGERWVGHAFHASRVTNVLDGVKQAMRVEPGRGVDGGDGEGLVFQRVFGTFMHVHALGTNTWAEAMVRTARTSRQLSSCYTPKVQ